MKKVFTILIAIAAAVLAAWAVLIGIVCWQETHVGDTEHYDAIIVLGAQVKPDGKPSVQLSWRLDAAA